MTIVAAAGFVAACALILLGLRLRADPRINAAVALLRSVPEGSSGPSGGLIAAVGRPLGPRFRKRLEEGLDAAGRSPANVDRLLGWKVIAALAGSALGVTAGGGTVIRMGAALLLAGAGFRLPDFLLARTRAARRLRMEDAVAPMLDVLSLSVAAGLTPRLALERVTEMVEGPLGTELRAARHDVSLGAPWREALRGVAARTGLRDLRRLAVTLDRSERLGAPVSANLRWLAREVRSERRAAAEERAQRAPVLMLFPLVFLILPAFVLAAVVPAVLVAARGLP